MASKLKLTAEPTFKAKVGIPIPGGKPVDVEFTFKHRQRSEAAAWSEHLRDDSVLYPQAVFEAAIAWDLEDEFSLANIERLNESYAGAGEAIIRAYLQELAGSRAKN